VERGDTVTSNSQELGNLNMLFSEALDGLASEARVPVNRARRNAVDQT
jgi:hypothetical protein